MTMTMTTIRVTITMSTNNDDDEDGNVDDDDDDDHNGDDDDQCQWQCSRRGVGGTGLWVGLGFEQLHATAQNLAVKTIVMIGIILTIMKLAWCHFKPFDGREIQQEGTEDKI